MNLYLLMKNNFLISICEDIDQKIKFEVNIRSIEHGHFISIINVGFNRQVKVKMMERFMISPNYFYYYYFLDIFSIGSINNIYMNFE